MTLLGSPRVVRVLPDVPAIDKQFDYLVPDGFGDQVRVGTMVRIALHGRRVGGWVVEDHVIPDDAVAGRLQPLAKVTGWGPSPDVIEVARWAAWRWAGRVATLLAYASPPGAVRNLPVAPPAPPPPSSPAVDIDVGELVRPGGAVIARLAPAADPMPVVLEVARYTGPGSILVLAPTVSAARDVAGRLRRAGQPVALLPRDWPLSAAGCRWIVGARGGAWAPVGEHGLAAVVVLDAHDDAHVEERTPTWSAVDVAVERARRNGAPAVLLTPAPTVEQVFAHGTPAAASRPAERSGWPAVDVVDLRQEDPRMRHLSGKVAAAVRSEREVLCVLNRKGRARLLACSACSELARCESCAAAVAERDSVLSCARCGSERPFVCLSCGATRLKNVRPGVTRLREELEALAGEPVGEVTSDTADIPRTRVLVGTEALLRRLPPSPGSAVAFIDLDQELAAPRVRAAEQALSLLVLAARRVGGRGAGGRLVLQTRMPASEVVQAVVLADPDRVADAERVRRQALRMPPFAAVALISGAGAEEYASRLAPRPEVQMLGPDDAGRWIARAPDAGTLADALHATPRPPGRLRVEVDPRRL